MFSPEATVPASLVSRNTKRRQRNPSDDSVALRHNPKRLRRSGINADTFEPPPPKTNGHVKHAQNVPYANGHADGSSQRDAASDTASLAIRNLASRKPQREKRGSRNEGTVLTKNEFYVVSQLPTTPDRLQAPQGSETWRAEIYNHRGFALAISQEYALIWRYTQDSTSIEPSKPLKIKLLHPPANARQPLPLGMLVPTSIPEEPSLLVVMPASGKITYWESLSSAASADSGRQKQQCAQGVVGGMMSGEVVTSIIEGEPHGFALTLSSGRVAHITIGDLQGKPSITTQYLRGDGTQSVGVFGGLKNIFSSASWRRDIAAVRAGFSAHRGHRQLVVATSKGEFQIWDLNWNGSQSLLCEIDGKADLLRSLSEGGDVFQDRHDHQFEVLDFTFSPTDLESKGPIRPAAKGDCQLWVLTTLRGRDSSQYNILGLILAAGSLTVNVVHPISCYKSPLSSDIQFKPQILVPEKGFAAFIVFEKSVVLISLVEVEESPSSQLKLEAHTLPDPFQDSIEYNKTKPYRNIACAAETTDADNSSSCVLMVHGFGMIRFLARPMQRNQSAVDRATVTAATKIEQAVFFGNMPQDLLDFSGRPEISFSQDQIERAAEDVSDSILKGVSDYIPREMPSVEAQLQRRAAALGDLIRHLRQRYGVLGRPTKWRLLWDAEKMAAAQKLWRTYQTNQNSAPKKDKSYKNFLAEVVETCSEEYKTENQPEKFETDGVRHYFINDIWRLECLLPYTDLTIQELLEESAENDVETGVTTHARYISEAIEYQVAALETAFNFREANLRSYDLSRESMIDGVLLQGYEGLDEPWTSTGHVAARVKDLTERALRFLDDAEESDEAVLARLTKNCPRQIELFNRTQIEQFRWLKAHSDPEMRATGVALQEQYFDLRKQWFVWLANVGCGDDALRLAQRYEDMDALVELVDFKRTNAQNPSALPVSDHVDVAPDVLLQKCDEEIVSFFAKYGNPWADAYFSWHIENNRAGRILEQSPMYQKALTAFLRRKPQYAKLRWINEVVAERNYLAAAESLQQTSERENKVWNKKIELSMAKLTLLAATQQTHLQNDVTKKVLSQTNRSVAIITIQEDLYNYMEPTLRSAIDADAEAILVMDKFKAVSAHQHFISGCMKRNVAHLVNRDIIEPEDLIETLIYMDAEGAEYYDDYIDRRFFLALQILRHLNLQKSDPARHQLLEAAIWRRCYIQDDWESINRTEDKEEEQTVAETERTMLFVTAKELFKNDNLHPTTAIPPPTSLLPLGTSLPSLRTSSRYTAFQDSDLVPLAKDLEHESRILMACIQRGRLEEVYVGVVEAARERLKNEMEQEAEEGRRELEVLRGMKEKG
ncbi:MAG: hypothetical protein Q9195_000535 [Heterodermia aff. obscurata]